MTLEEAKTIIAALRLGATSDNKTTIAVIEAFSSALYYSEDHSKYLLERIAQLEEQIETQRLLLGVPRK